MAAIEGFKSKVRRLTPRATGRGGFTLIETTLALALTAIGLIALLGLIPHGLKVMKAATDRSIEARIAQELVSEVMVAEWSRIDMEYDKSMRYFDNEGVEIEKTGGGGDSSGEQEFANKLTYTALIEIPDQTTGASAAGGGFRLPGIEASDPDIKRVVVRIINTPFEIDLNDETIREEYEDRISTYASTIVKMVRNE